MDSLTTALMTEPKSVDSDIMDTVIAQLSDQKVTAEEIVNLPVMSRVHQSSDRIHSWLKYEIFLTKVLTSGVVSVQEFESAVLPLLKSPMDRSLQAKFGSCLKGAITSYRRSKSSFLDEEFIQVLEWIGWLCSPAADF